MQDAEDVAADLIFYNGKFITVDPDFSIASALAVKDDKFLTLGPDNEILAWAGASTRTVDLQGKIITPGFIDSHIHAIRASGNTVSLEETRSVAEILAVFREKVRQTPENTWIGAFPFMSIDQIEEGHLPNRWELDSVSPNHPVFIFYHGHLVATNSLALKEAGITRATSPQKWVIKDPATGEPNGGLLEDLAGWVIFT